MNLARVLTGLKRRLGKAALRLWVQRRSQPSPQLVRLGSDYGGWFVPRELLDGEEGLAVCAGVGEDATLELALLERSQMKLLSMDPTPRAIEYVEPLVEQHDRWQFEPVGLWSAEERLRFYEPADGDHVSHSIGNLQDTESFIEVDCTTLSSAIAPYADLPLHFLKMDIEGAEFEVLQSMLRDEHYPTALGIEFDQPCSLLDIRRQLLDLEEVGYRLATSEGWNVTLVREAMRA